MPFLFSEPPGKKKKKAEDEDINLQVEFCAAVLRLEMGPGSVVIS